MSKNKSITLLIIVSVIMAIVLTMTFLRFPMGVKDYNSAVGATELDYDMEGGLSYSLTLHEDTEEEVTLEDTQEVVTSIKERLEILGHNVSVVKVLKNTDKDVKDYGVRIEVKVKDTTDETDEDVLTATKFGELKFFGGTEPSPTTQILEDVDKVIADSQYLGQTEEGAYVVSLVFTDEGRQAILDTIGEEATYYLRITCGLDNDGNDIDLFDPDSTFDPSLFADGNKELMLSSTTAQEAQRKALLFKHGGINVRYEIANGGVGVEITSPFGEYVALKSMIAIIVTVVIAIALLLIAYRGLGIMAALSFLLFILAETWLLIGVPGIVVSLGSIIGIISAILVCAYSLVYLLQKVKDDFANSEKTAKAAIKKGFEDALLPTINLHVVSGILALTLFIFTKGFVKGFAITFGIGIIVSLISSLVFTRMFNALIFPLPKDKEKFLKFKRNNVGKKPSNEEV